MDWVKMVGMSVWGVLCGVCGGLVFYVPPPPSVRHHGSHAVTGYAKACTYGSRLTWRLLTR